MAGPEKTQPALIHEDAACVEDDGSEWRACRYLDGLERRACRLSRRQAFDGVFGLFEPGLHHGPRWLGGVNELFERSPYVGHFMGGLTVGVSGERSEVR